MRKFLTIVTLVFSLFLFSNVHAAVNSFSATINGYNLAIGNYWYFQAGNQNIIIDVNGYPDGLENPSDYWYSSLVLCESSPTSPSAIYAQGTNATAIKDLRAIRTNYRCFTDENGNSGKVTAILYQQTGGGSYNKQNFVYYMNTGIVTLLDYNVSLNGYYDLSKFSNINSIIDQRTIVDQNNTIINGQEDIKNNTEDIKDTLKDDNIDTSKSNSFFSNFTDEDNGGISGVVTAPLRFIRKITNTCTPFTLKVMEQDVTLPCGNTLFWDKPEVATFKTTWNALVGGAILYALVVKLFKVISDLKNPDSSKVEVLDL